MKIALAQTDIVYEDIHSNFATVEQFVGEAKQNESVFIIFPFSFFLHSFFIGCRSFEKYKKYVFLPSL